MDIINKKLEDQISFLQNEVNQVDDEFFITKRNFRLKERNIIIKRKI